jgi:hypothetical protein
MTLPIFDCVTKRKTDKKKEIINEEFLKDEFYKLISNYSEVIIENSVDSFLVTRDGNDCGIEFEVMKAVLDLLKNEGKVPLNLSCTFIEYHKSSRKEIRLWEANDVHTDNILEGSYFKPNIETAIMSTTGAATLSQGTSDPIVLVNTENSNEFNRAIEDIFVNSQFNFSSPKKAQRLTLVAKRADDQLKEKRSQEIKRIR